MVLGVKMLMELRRLAAIFCGEFCANETYNHVQTNEAKNFAANTPTLLTVYCCFSISCYKHSLFKIIIPEN